VYAWGGGDGAVRAGERMLLAYNCGSGKLAHTNSAKLHLGVDGWKDKQKTVGHVMRELGCSGAAEGFCMEVLAEDHTARKYTCR
jgi:hypothetical protein